MNDGLTDDRLPLAPPLERVDAWLRSHRRAVLVALLVLATTLRVVTFVQLHDSPVMMSYAHTQMDMQFFDRWAIRILKVDPVGREALHPVHSWHGLVAKAHFETHPELLDRSFAEFDLAAKTAATKRLWNDWYGGPQFHQEPLYPYLIAASYWLCGQPDVRWIYGLQSLAGLCSVVLLFLMARQMFGDLVATVTGGIAAAFGVLMHYEAALLRASLVSFFGILILFLGRRVLDTRITCHGRIKPRARRVFGLLIFGVVVGLAAALKSTLLLIGLGILAARFWSMRARWRPASVDVCFALGGVVLVLAPILIRNAVVGAPLFSVSSVAAVTFAGANVPGIDPASGWYPYDCAARIATVMAESDGAFFAAVLSTLGMYGSLAEYIQLLWFKVAQLFHGYELPNNTNYYYSTLHSSVLGFTRYVVSTTWVLPTGIAGLVMAWVQRRAVGIWLWYFACGAASMIVLYVLSRFRVPMVVAVIPFSAFAFVQTANWVLQRRWNPVVVTVALTGVMVLWGARGLEPSRPEIDPGMYESAMEHYYMPALVAANKRQDTARATEILGALLATAPGYIAELGGDRPIRHHHELRMAKDVFAPAYGLLAGISRAKGEPESALRYEEERQRLVRAADGYENPGAR